MSKGKPFQVAAGQVLHFCCYFYTTTAAGLCYQRLDEKYAGFNLKWKNDFVVPGEVGTISYCAILLVHYIYIFYNINNTIVNLYNNFNFNPGIVLFSTGTNVTANCFRLLPLL